MRLEGIEDPELVLDAIAGTFGLVESPQTTPIERLQAFLAGRSILLVLDNFEHLMPAAAGIHALLERAGPDVRLVVTSRAPLRIGLEQEFPVGQLDPSDAIGLFVERARRADPSFGLTDENRSAVAEICDHLDGLPLGIELAASRIGLLPAPAIADQLTRRLDLPGVAPRDLPARQRTLTDAIAWSYSLLDEPPRRLLERLSVFAGGFRLAELDAGRRAGSRTWRRADRRALRPRRAEPGRVDPRARRASLSAARDDPALRRWATRRTRRDVASPGSTRPRLPCPGGGSGPEHAEPPPAAVARPDDRRSRQPARGVRLGAGARRRGAGPPTARGELAVLAVPRPRDGGRGQGLGGAGDAGRRRPDRLADASARGGRRSRDGGQPTSREPTLHYEGQLALARTLGDQRGIADALVQPGPHAVRRSPGGPCRTWRPCAPRRARSIARWGTISSSPGSPGRSAYPLAFAGRSDEAKAIILGTLVEFERVGGRLLHRDGVGGDGRHRAHGTRRPDRRPARPAEPAGEPGDGRRGVDHAACCARLPPCGRWQGRPDVGCDRCSAPTKATVVGTASVHR